MLRIKQAAGLILLLAAAYSISGIPVTAAADSAYKVSENLGSYDTLKQACDAINAEPGEQYTITVHSDDPDMGEAAVIENGKTVTLRSAENICTISQKNGRHLVLRGSLRLEHIILDGNLQGGGVDADGGILDIGRDATISNCIAAGKGGAVLAMNKSQIILSDGTISSCSASSGGGAALDTGSLFNMTGGSIRDCRTNTDGQAGGGGVAVLDAEAVFTLVSGSVTGNQTFKGNHAPGGGVSVHHGKFIMKGGSVQNNTSYTYGGGVNVANNGTVQIAGGSIANNTAENANGGGIAVLFGTVNMSGGDIQNNACNGNYMGGGVWLGYGYTTAACQFTMSGGQISGNTAAAGGGVFLRYGNSSFILKGGDIQNNTAKFYGGGIAAEQRNFADPGNASGDEKPSVTISGGTIQKNDAGASGVYGGAGIFLLAGAKLHMSGGFISENTSLAYGGGIASMGGNGILMSGGAITHNTAELSGGGVYLYGVDSPFLTMSGNAGIYQNQADGSADDVSSVDSGIITLLPVTDMELPDTVNADSWYYDTAGYRYREGQSQGKYTPVAADSSELHLTLGIREERYSVTYKDGMDGKAFKDILYPDLEYGSPTPAFDPENPASVPELEGYIFSGWKPEVQDNVTSHHIYTAQWKEITAPDSPDPSIPDPDPSIPDPDGDSPTTGDSSKIAVLGILLAAAIFLLVIAARTGRKKNVK